VKVCYSILLRKRRGGGEKLGGVGFLEVNSAFLFEGGGERGLGFIYPFLLLLFFVNVLLFFLTFEGERGDTFFFFFFNKKS